jgi:hypothetical protein
MPAFLTKHHLGDQVRRNEMGGHVACMRKRRGAYRILVGKPEGKKPLRRHRRRWENNIITILRRGMSRYGLD